MPTRSNESQQRRVVEPARPQPASWTGFYVGGNAGVGWGSPTTMTGNNSTATGGGVSVFVPLNPAQYSPKFGGWMAGVQAGYDYQIGRSILGIETDFNWTDINGKVSNTAICAGFGAGAPFCTYTQNQKLEWFGTVRGRFGYLIVPGTAVYATGGLAYGRVVVSHSLFSSGFVGTFIANGASSDTRTGWVIGAGIESLIAPNWTARLEYLHYDLGTLTSIAPISGPGGGAAWGNFGINGDLARAALIYKFH